MHFDVWQLLVRRIRLRPNNHWEIGTRSGNGARGAATNYVMDVESARLSARETSPSGSLGSPRAPGQVDPPPTVSADAALGF